MIGKLTGTIDTLMKDSVILDVNGVGYVVSVSPRTSSSLQGVGHRVSLLIHTHVREDQIQLFGFADYIEQDWFNLLVTVQGVGNKVALAILGACPPEKLALIIASQDKAAISQADGVGPKLALRLLTELKDKAGDVGKNRPLAVIAPAPIDHKLNTPAPDTGEHSVVVHGSELVEEGEDTLETEFDDAAQGLMDDGIAALTSLGYGRSDAYSAVSTVLAREKDVRNISRLVTLGLKELSL